MYTSDRIVAKCFKQGLALNPTSCFLLEPSLQNQLRIVVILSFHTILECSTVSTLGMTEVGVTCHQFGRVHVAIYLVDAGPTKARFEMALRLLSRNR